MSFSIWKMSKIIFLHWSRKFCPRGVAFKLLIAIHGILTHFHGTLTHFHGKLTHFRGYSSKMCQFIWIAIAILNVTGNNIARCSENWTNENALQGSKIFSGIVCFEVAEIVVSEVRTRMNHLWCFGLVIIS